MEKCDWSTLFEECTETPTHMIVFGLGWGSKYYCEPHHQEMLGEKRSKHVKEVREL